MEVQRMIRDQDDSGLLNLATTVDSTLREQTQKPSVIKQSSTWTSTSDTSTLSESSDSVDSYRTQIVPFYPSEKQESSDTSKSSSASLENISPPVAEIQIRHRNETATVLPEEDNDEYKTRYFCGQRDLHVLQEQMDHVCEENRLLRRKLIELQKQLFHNVRTKRRVVEANSAWSVPESASLRHKKRQRNNVSIVEKDIIYLEHNTSNGRDDLCSSNDLLQTSCDAVISTVTSEELSVSSSKA